jgi:hypothetical protein
VRTTTTVVPRHKKVARTPPGEVEEDTDAVGEAASEETEAQTGAEEASEAEELRHKLFLGIPTA